MKEAVMEILSDSAILGADQAWRAHKVVSFCGSGDTRKWSGQDYDTLTLGQVFDMPPGNAEKMQALAIIPSSYCASDARTHDVQREHGEYVALALDVDTGNLEMEQVSEALRGFAGNDVAVLIYSSSSASEQQRKWRGMIPLAKPVGFEQWQELQHALFRDFELAAGAKPDYALDRAGQPVYMPNVPPARRDSFGDPEFYRHLVIPGRGLAPSCGRVREALQALRRERAELDAQIEARREKAREAAARRSMGSGKGSGALEIIKRFNSANSIDDLLRANGYDQKGRSNDWRSPYQTSGSYATRNYGAYWVSLSQSDAAAGLGRQTAGSASTCFGDAFDLALHFDYGGSIKRALRALSDQEREDRRADMGRFDDKPSSTAAQDFGEFINSAPSMAACVPAIPASVPAVPASAATSIKPDAAVIEAARELIRTASHADLMSGVPDQIRLMKGIDDKGLEALAQDYKKAMALHGSRIKIDQARKTITNKPLEDAIAAAKAKAFEDYKATAGSTVMLKDWVYLEQPEKFMNLKDGRMVSTKSFDMIYAKDVPVMPDEERPQSPSRFFSMTEGRTAYAEMYVPKFWRDDAGGQFFDYEGRWYLNGYSGRSLPPIKPGWKDREHYKTIEQHMTKLMSCEREARLMIEWMAHNVQHPGVKILWAPVIYGPQGSGKTTIERIMSAIMGQANVRTISMDEIYSPFSSWAMGACVGFLEEIRIVGHSRHDLTNKLKPFITNERVKIVKKGQDGLDALNTQNYCCFTNFDDAVPVDSEDRRYGVMATAAKNRQDVVEMFPPEYWAQLYGSINEHAGDIRAWLLSVDLSGFDRIAAPPMTQGKLDMIEATRSDDVINLEMVIEAGAHGVTAEVVSQSHLNQALRAAGYSTIGGRRQRKCLDDLGFVQAPWTIKFDNKTCRVSVRGEWLERLQAMPEGHEPAFRRALQDALSVSEF
jgi:hypothetical protein